MKNIVYILCFLCLFACGKSTTSVGDGAYYVSGTVTSSGAALPGVTVTFTGTSSGTATTGSDGKYSFTGVNNGVYQVTAAIDGYVFSPANLSVSVASANVTGIDFTAAKVATTQLPKTGQTTSYTGGDDGALQKGVASPSPRFTDNGDGTVTDNLTGLIWLKNANCFGLPDWATALTFANTLVGNSTQCSLSDGSIPGDWRLPNITELESLIDLQNTSGIALPAGHPFTGVQAGYYWSSSNFVGITAFPPFTIAWVVDVRDGYVAGGDKSGTPPFSVWPVRGGL